MHPVQKFSTGQLWAKPRHDKWGVRGANSVSGEARLTQHLSCHPRARPEDPILSESFVGGNGESGHQVVVASPAMPAARWVLGTSPRMTPLLAVHFTPNPSPSRGGGIQPCLKRRGSRGRGSGGQAASVRLSASEDGRPSVSKFGEQPADRGWSSWTRTHRADCNDSPPPCGEGAEVGVMRSL